MSQSENPTHGQALLESMLQRLKLQSGREGQTCLHTPVPITAASTWGQDEESGAFNLSKRDNSLVNGFGTNVIASKEFGISAVDNNFVFKDGKIQHPGPGCQVVRGRPSFPTPTLVNGDQGQNRVLGQATQPGITSTGLGKSFPAKSFKDAYITSLDRTNRERVSLERATITRHTPRNKDAVASIIQNLDLDQGFTFKRHVWSLNPANANVDTGSQDNKVFHVGNGTYRALAQSDDPQMVPTDQNTTNSSSRRKQGTSENKAKIWTQKIKERWRDRPGSFGKKRKEEERRDEQKSEQRTEISSQSQPLTAETYTNTSNKEEEWLLPSLDSSDPTMSSSSDFEFGLGSCNLLEEIAMGQEWAKFLNPDQSAALANQRSSEELKIPPNPDGGSQSPLISSHQDVTNQLDSRSTVASSPSDFSRAQISPGSSLPVSMDVTDGKQQHVHREANRSESMVYGHTSSARPADILNNTVLKSRTPLNRKRQHRSAETEDGRHAKKEDRGESKSPPSPTSSHVMDVIESQHNRVVPSCILNSPPLFPSSFTPFVHAPKGVLKHSISHDSESSVGIETKRRRVEENRRVHFSEEMVTIIPPQLDLDGREEEEEEEEEEDSVSEESEVEQAGIEEVEQAVKEEVAPARRPSLPAWMLVLKTKNSMKKHR